MRGLWYLGKALQVLAMTVTGMALIVGLQSQDAFTELKMLVTGILIFMGGVLMVKVTEGRGL